MCAAEITQTEILAALDREVERLGLSSWHLLFASNAKTPEAGSTSSAPLLTRADCQFHWHNRGYADFDDFLRVLRSDKRKNLRKERRKVAQQGVVIERLKGAQIDPAQLESFYQFYRYTYLCRGQRPYLNRAFFEQLTTSMADQLLLVIAYQKNQPCGAALFLFDETTLYGRWWGGDPAVYGLHFEVCYYQGIEFAIEQQLSRFDPGTQGEHKLIRGFEPVLTHSLHRISDPRLAEPLLHWTRTERRHVAAYRRAAEQALPFAAR